jgi:hypothetical protein
VNIGDHTFMTMLWVYRTTHPDDFNDFLSKKIVIEDTFKDALKIWECANLKQH